MRRHEACFTCSMVIALYNVFVASSIFNPGGILRATSDLCLSVCYDCAISRALSLRHRSVAHIHNDEVILLAASAKHPL
jgi:hypothetical protein